MVDVNLIVRGEELAREQFGLGEDYVLNSYSVKSNFTELKFSNELISLSVKIPTYLCEEN